MARNATRFRLSSMCRRTGPAGRLGLAVAILAALCGVSVPAAATALPSCRTVTVPVTGAETVAGTLCTPAGPPARTIEVLVSGLTYDRIYWQLPAGPDSPGYQLALARAGYATLAVDRLGTGASSHPAASELTYPNELAALHQVIGAVRAGTLGSYRHLVLVGHSYGSGLAVGEAGSYHDVDALVLSGWAHAQGSAGTAFYGALTDARTDPVTGPSNPPAGYLTTTPGSRASFFDASGDASPAVEWADEATKSTLSQAELATISDAYDPGLAAAVSVPVLVAIGQRDVLTCGVTLACGSAAEIGQYESQLFTGSPGLTGYLLAGAGHSINLAGNAGDWFRASASWTRAQGL